VPGLGGVEQLIGKGVGELRHARLDFAIAALLFSRQVDTGQAEVAQGIVDAAALGFVQLGPGQALVFSACQARNSPSCCPSQVL
jgi:hypothetical protein